MGAAVDASPLGGLMYFPTALVRDQLPVGLDELGGVPMMSSTPGATLKARLKRDVRSCSHTLPPAADPKTNT